MEQIYQSFLDFIAAYGYIAVAVLMAMENACIPIPSEFRRLMPINPLHLPRKVLTRFYLTA